MIAAVSLTLDSITADPARKASARKAAGEFFGHEFKGSKVRKGIRSVTRLRWHTKLKEAARHARKTGRPILWIQALGDIGGYT